MAAGALTEVLGGTPEQVENAVIRLKDLARNLKGLAEENRLARKLAA